MARHAPWGTRTAPIVGGDHAPVAQAPETGERPVARSGFPSAMMGPPALPGPLRLSDLEAVRNPLHAALQCLGAMFDACTFRSGLICVSDVDTHELVVVGGSGPEASPVMLARDTPEAEPFFSASCIQRPIVHHYTMDVRPTVQRHLWIAEPSDVLVAPIISWGRSLGTFELISRPGAFGPSALAMIEVIATRYAAYLDSLNVVLGFSLHASGEGVVLQVR